ncbi:putative exocyst complex component EXOC2/Sec5 [Lupinus albus]|uniref:Exocyst complex component SEC5 n=1 Tax=Lupinus albus TaxID=3870 RepID=A0A6A4QCQ8_LUPAL|nr:putative exocyst complex component EXOC2/Sec5 [Lupinus albus]
MYMYIVKREWVEFMGSSCFLARRVREMRETRSAPVAQKFAHKIERKGSAVGRKGLTYLQSFPRGMECVDPLGLGQRNFIKHRNLESKVGSLESNPCKAWQPSIESLTSKLCKSLLEYFETILNPYFTSDARDSLKSLQGLLLEKATETVTDAIDHPEHNRRATRGSEDALADDKQQGTTISPDELIALAQQYSTEFLQAELERTRINTACFSESIPLDSVPEPAKSLCCLQELNGFSKQKQ